jgi:hypothetical protein
MGLHFSNKISLKPIELFTKMNIASILLHLHSLGIINHLQFSTSIPTLPYLNELEIFFLTLKENNDI